MKLKEKAITEGLCRAHESLLEDLRRLELAVGPASGESLTELRRRLAATRTHITKHFRYEEENGYMDVVRKREPRLVRTVEHLAEEHRQLSQGLDEILAEVQQATSLSDAVREKVRLWVRHVGEHELRENDLVQDAFNQDIGAED